MKLSLFILVMCAYVVCNGQSNVQRSIDFPIVNSESVSLLVNKPKAFQLIIDKVSGIVNGKVIFQNARRDNRGNLVGWTIIKEQQLVNVKQQIILSNFYFEKVTIETKGTMLLKLKYLIKQ